MEYTTRVMEKLVPRFMKDLFKLLDRDKQEKVDKSEGNIGGFKFLFE